MEMPKYHLDLSTDKHMFHLRTDSEEEMKAFTGIENLNARTVMAFMSSMGPNTLTPPPNQSRPNQGTDTLISCQFCQGTCTDNRQSKASPTSPDFRCRECGAIAWVQRSGALSWRKPR